LAQKGAQMAGSVFDRTIDDELCVVAPPRATGRGYRKQHDDSKGDQDGESTDIPATSFANLIFSQSVLSLRPISKVLTSPIASHRSKLEFIALAVSAVV